jgi:predicted MPP superfamily phosphohydrolase
MSLLWRIIIAVPIIILIQYYFLKKFNRSLKTFFPGFQDSARKKWIRVLLIIFNIYPAYLLIASGYAMAALERRINLPEHFLFDYFVLFPFWVWIFIVIQSILILLPLDLIRLMFLPLYNKYEVRIKPFEQKLIFGIIVFFIVYVPLRIVYDLNSVSIRVTEYQFENLPDDLKGLKITFVADIQADRFTDERRLSQYIEKINAANPDLVLIAGDIITSTPGYIDVAAEYIGKINSKYGVYSCVGDHDHWAYREDTPKSIRELTGALAKYNVKMIDNEKHILTVGKSEIGIAFVTNTYPKRLRSAELDSLLDGNFKNDINIILVHQPSEYLIEKAKEYKYNLLLAGHTHGGQVTFLFPFYNLSPTLFETKYVRGDFRFDNLLMIVNRGLGMSLVPLRLNSTPEVTVIGLVSN